MLIIFKSHVADGHGATAMARYPAPDEPSPAQAEAGNYAKRVVPWNGLRIRVENEAGSIRYGRGWQTRMLYPYGYIERSEGTDGDEVDVYLGPALDFAPMVYVVHQMTFGDWEKPDEDKCMLGFLSAEDAATVYLKHYDDPRFLGSITEMPVDEFVAKVRATRQKPAMIKTHVDAYTKKNGTFIAAHDDARHARYADLFKPSLGYRREDMPQVPNGIKPKFLDELRARGVSVERAMVDAATLKPTQANYNVANMDHLAAEAKAGRIDDDNPCLVSSDGRVLDGHHRWAVAALDGRKLSVIKVGMPIAEMLQVAEKLNSENGIERRSSSGAPDHLVKAAGDEAPNTSASTMLVFMKARVGAYLRGGKLVNLSGYQGRAAQAQPAPGQMALFTHDEAPPPAPRPNPFRGKDPVLDTPDLFTGQTRREAPVESPAELAAEHRRLVTVLRSPSHADDKVEAEKQSAELKGYEAQAGQAAAPAAPAKPHPLAASAAELAAAHHRLAEARASGKADGFEAHVVEHREESHRALESAFAAHSAHGDGTELSNKDGRRHAILLPDASSPGKYRYQTFDASGFSSHSTHDTPEEAVADAASQGYTAHNPGILDRLAGADEWSHGMAINAVMQAHNSGQIDWRTAMDKIKALNDERDAKKAAAVAPAPAAPADDHPSKPTRSLLNLVPEEKRAEWEDLHRRQHEMHHYDLGLIKEELEKARAPMRRAQTAMREAEAGAAEARKGGDLPGTDERVRDADAAVARHRAEFDKRRAEVDRLSASHQDVYEKVVKLGRQKEAIASATGDMGIDWASMKQRTAEDQRKHEKSMLAAYRQHYKGLRGRPMAKAWDWLGTTPLRGQLTIFNMGAAMPQNRILFLKSYVNSYTRADGTVVEAHEQAHGAWRRHDEHTYRHPSGAVVRRNAAGGDKWDLHQTDGEVRRGYGHPMTAMHDADLNDDGHKKVIKEYGDTVNDQRHERRRG